MADVWVNPMACHPRATCNTAECCHLANSMSWFKSYVSHCRVLPLSKFNGMSSHSHVSHCRVLPLGEFTVMIPKPHATLQGAVTWQNQCHDRATLQGVIIPSAILRIVFRHMLFFKKIQFGLWRTAAFVSSSIHLFCIILHNITNNIIYYNYAITYNIYYNIHYIINCCLLWYSTEYKKKKEKIDNDYNDNYIILFVNEIDVSGVDIQTCWLRCHLPRPNIFLQSTMSKLTLSHSRTWALFCHISANGQSWSIFGKLTRQWFNRNPFTSWHIQHRCISIDLPWMTTWTGFTCVVVSAFVQFQLVTPFAHDRESEIWWLLPQQWSFVC